MKISEVQVVREFNTEYFKASLRDLIGSQAQPGCGSPLCVGEVGDYSETDSCECDGAGATITLAASGEECWALLC